MISRRVEQMRWIRELPSIPPNPYPPSRRAGPFRTVVLDTARGNALSIYAMTFDLSEAYLDTFDVIWALAESLVRPFVEARSLNGLSTKTRLKISLLLGTKPQTQTTAPATPSGLKQRCHLCLKEIAGQEGYKQAKDRMTKVKTACSYCQKACCSKHFSVICTDCDV